MILATTCTMRLSAEPVACRPSRWAAALPTALVSGQSGVDLLDRSAYTYSLLLQLSGSPELTGLGRVAGELRDQSSIP